MSNSPLVSHTRLSPNCTKPRNHAIDTITIHCVVGQVTAERLGEIFAPTARQASSNYGVDKDGRIGLYVDEKNRSWCTSSSANDNRAVTIEVASDNKHPYKVTDKALAGLIALLVDICKRNGIKALLWKGDKSLIGKVDQQNMTVHRWFANKACPGEYLYNMHGKIAEEVNKRLGSPSRGEPDRPTYDPAKLPVLKYNLFKHIKGDNVRMLQTLLRKWTAAALPRYGIDGDFGAETRDWVKKFQATHKDVYGKALEVDGIVGVLTWSALLNL